MTNILEKIVADRRKSVAATQTRISLEEIKQKAQNSPIPPSFSQAFQSPKIHIIAELKKMSPSQGLIRKEFYIEPLAQTLERHGATALSVLTETPHFGGCIENLIRAKSTVSIPLLRKDFIIEPYQIYEARAYGASAILLIAASLSTAELIELTTLAHQLNLEVLGEIHNEAELEMMLEADVDLIGVNARNLKNFSTSLELSCALIQQVPSHKIPIAESAITSHNDILTLQKAGARGFLIGTTLMSAENPGKKLTELIHG